MLLAQLFERVCPFLPHAGHIKVKVELTASGQPDVRSFHVTTGKPNCERTNNPVGSIRARTRGIVPAVCDADSQFIVVTNDHASVTEANEQIVSATLTFTLEC